jgi:glutamine amidotransferase
MECQTIHCGDELKVVDKIILPGVGSFDYAMSKLNNSGMKDQLTKLVLDNKIPVLGVCVGMQMLLNKSEEGKLNGLGWIDGVVKKFVLSDQNTTPMPHMGWNAISKIKDHRIMTNLDNQSRFYFLHSYYVDCKDGNNVLAAAHYQNDYACIINKDNIYGMQCHPEKSHHNGIQFLKNFGEL